MKSEVTAEKSMTQESGIKFDCEICGKIDYAFADGYHVGDRLLEGVRFEIRKNSDGTCTAKIAEDSKEYFSDLNQRKWLNKMAKWAEQHDVFECPKCKNDVVPDDMLRND